MKLKHEIIAFVVETPVLVDINDSFFRCHLQPVFEPHFLSCLMGNRAVGKLIYEADRSWRICGALPLFLPYAIMMRYWGVGHILSCKSKKVKLAL